MDLDGRTGTRAATRAVHRLDDLASAERALAERQPPGQARRRAVVCAATLALAAATLAWSLRIPAGDPLFYPATLLLAAILLGGGLLAGRPLRPGLDEEPGHLGRRVTTGLVAGAVLLVVFLVGAVGVAQVPALREPVQQLLDHAVLGSLPAVLGVTVLNGIVEEVFYRGALYDAVAGRRPVLVTTVVYTAVTALAGIPLLALAAALLGLATAGLRRLTRGLVASIIAHLVWSVGMLLLLDPTLSLLEPR